MKVRLKYSTQAFRYAFGSEKRRASEILLPEAGKIFSHAEIQNRIWNTRHLDDYGDI